MPSAADGDRLAPVGAGDAYPLGPRTTGSLAWWGTVMALIGVMSMHVTLLFARVYLVGAGERTPPLLAPAVATLLLVASTVPAGVAHRTGRSGTSATRSALALAAAALLGVAHLGVHAVDVAGLRLDPTGSAEDATFVTILGFHYVLVGVGVVAMAVAALQAVVQPPRARTSSAVVAVVLWWVTVAASWLAVVAVLYLLPRWA